MSDLSKVTEEMLRTLNISEEEVPSERTKDNGEETSVRSKDDNEQVENEQPEYIYRTRTMDLESEDSDAVSKILLTLSCIINSQFVPSQLQASLT